mmetsp:Transcript_18244/g.61534  ORF Transcript_18244/g.61534 Transcript_18244/m.61534 type:complete len:203 (-) Transcript_18244:280-888(-)
MFLATAAGLSGGRFWTRKRLVNLRTKVQGVPLRLRRLDGSGRGAEHDQGHFWVVGGRLRPRGGGPGGGPGRETGRRLADYCCRRQSGQVRNRADVGRHRLLEPDGLDDAHRAAHRPDDAVGLRLYLRLHRQRQGHARGARVRAPRLGHVLRHRRRRFGAGNFHEAVSAHHGPQVGRHRLWRLQVADRGPEADRAAFGGAAAH